MPYEERFHVGDGLRRSNVEGVFEVWESREKFEAFGEKLGPRIEEAGIQMSGEPEVFEAHIFETF